MSLAKRDDERQLDYLSFKGGSREILGSFSDSSLTVQDQQNAQ